MARLTSENAAREVGGLYDLVLIASRRTRELRNGYTPLVQSENGEIVTALKEIESGLVGRDYLHKPQDIERDGKRKTR